MSTIRDLYSITEVKIIYCPSENYQFYLQQKIHELLDVSKENRLHATNDREVKTSYAIMTTPPFEGDYWVTHINYNKAVSQKCIDSVYTRNHNYGLIFIWVTDYRDIFRVKTKIYEKNFKESVPFLTFSGLDLSDMEEYMRQVPKELRLPRHLEDYVFANYAFDVPAFTELVSYMQGGMDFRTENDIIQAIGLGRRTVDGLIIKLLTSSTKTSGGVKRLFGEALFYIEHLHIKHDYRSIYNFMSASASAFFDLKMYQINGFQGTGLVPFPDKAKRIRRFERKVEQDITLVDILNLQLALRKNYNQDARLSIIMALSSYMDYKYSKGGGDKGERERKELSKEKRERKKKDKEEREMRGRV